MITDRGVYKAGKLVQRPVDVDAAVRAIRADPEAFCWIGLAAPARTELDPVARAFELPRLAVEDALGSHQRPKVEPYDDVVLAVLKTVRYPEHGTDVEAGEIAIFVGRNFVVTVQHGTVPDATLVRADIERRAALVGHGLSAVLYGICDRIVDAYVDVASRLDLDVDDLEQAVFSSAADGDTAAIFRVERRVLQFRRAVAPLVGPMSRLAAGTVPGIDPDTKSFFRNVADHLIRTTEEVETHDDLLNSVFQAHLAQVGVRQNEDMRKISAWVAIVAVPTGIAGIYGMNFQDMPELHWTFGYPGALLLMLVICISLHRWFKRVGWL